jgi:hypothetical protein
MLVAYAPFFWYWISVIRKLTNLTDAEIRARDREIEHYWGEE